MKLKSIATSAIILLSLNSCAPQKDLPICKEIVIVDLNYTNDTNYSMDINYSIQEFGEKENAY